MTLRSDYNVLLVDPPWRYDFAQSTSRAVENQYPTMSMAELCAMQPFINQRHAGSAILFMWATAPKLEDALGLMRTWGFKYKTFDLWVKEKRNKNRDQLLLDADWGPEEAAYFGMGYYTRVRHEPMLIGTCGSFSPPEPARRPPSVFYGEVGEHSKKPEIARERIEFMYPEARRVELFARDRRDGWDAWGNEV